MQQLLYQQHDCHGDSQVATVAWTP